MIKLWENGSVPYFNDACDTAPYLDEYLVDDTVRPCVIVFPGGGYAHLSPHEGETTAQFFRAKGFHAFVLQYRLAPLHRHPAMLADALRAIRLVRHRAKEFFVDPEKIAICGFSAGGHLAGTAATLYDHPFEKLDAIDEESARPDAAILCYAVMSFVSHVNTGTYNNLLSGYEGEELETLRHYLSVEEHITENTPPMFLWHASSDPAVPPENSLNVALQLQKHHIPYALHVFPSGGHGRGLAWDIPYTNTWSDLCCDWLRTEMHF